MQTVLRLCIFLVFIGTYATAQTTRFGQLLALTEIPGTSRIEPRVVYVWLPPHYQSSQQYPVLYFQDGQMLFDSSKTWNHQSWALDEQLGSYMYDKPEKSCILVGIANSNKRFNEYFPEDATSLLSKQDQEAITENQAFLANDYLHYVVSIVKPYIDQHFATKKEAKFTAIVGSSMGGLISAYAVCKYPEIFGTALCLSTHWPGSIRVHHASIPKALIHWFKKNLPAPENHYFYFDYGTESLDAAYAPWQHKMDRAFKQKGYSPAHFKSICFPGAGHTERDWSKRITIPFLFFIQSITAI